MKPLLLLILAAICLTLSVTGAIIHGTVYGPDFEVLKNAVVRINTTPPQQMVARDGSFSFEVGEGNYVLTAVYKETENYVTEESITIADNGDYVLDLLLNPTLNEDISPYPDIDEINLQNATLDNPYPYPYVFPSLVFAIVVALIALGIYLFFRLKEQKEILPASDDDYYAQVYNLIKKSQRLTQKEIRKEIPFSEAKISLILAEMEAKGVISKIKKGRGNIIIFQKK